MSISDSMEEFADYTADVSGSASVGAQKRQDANG
jgi:hypothetical protein